MTTEEKGAKKALYVTVSPSSNDLRRIAKKAEKMQRHLLKAEKLAREIGFEEVRLEFR